MHLGCGRNIFRNPIFVRRLGDLSVKHKSYVVNADKLRRKYLCLCYDIVGLTVDNVNGISDPVRQHTLLLIVTESENQSVLLLSFKIEMVISVYVTRIVHHVRKGAMRYLYLAAAVDEVSRIRTRREHSAKIDSRSRNDLVKPYILGRLHDDTHGYSLIKSDLLNIHVLRVRHKYSREFPARISHYKRASDLVIDICIFTIRIHSDKIFTKLLKTYVNEHSTKESVILRRAAVREIGARVRGGLTVGVKLKRESVCPVILPTVLWAVKAPVSVLINAAEELLAVEFQNGSVVTRLNYLRLRIHRHCVVDGKVLKTNILGIIDNDWQSLVVENERCTSAVHRDIFLVNYRHNDGLYAAVVVRHIVGLDERALGTKIEFTSVKTERISVIHFTDRLNERGSRVVLIL